MRQIRRIILSLYIISFSINNNAQENKNWSLSGYLSEMLSIIMIDPDSALLYENLLHNRLNFEWNPSKNWKLNIGMRNRLIAGNILQYSGYAESISFDKGWVDLSWNVFDEKNMLLSASFDRVFVTFEKDKWNVKLGRQRINWGQTLVWNPNDIFNTYSYFDFDYVERSGCDAVRGAYYHNATSSTELAVSVDYNNDVTAALLHRWNYKETDYQLIGGVLTGNDVLIGGACTGEIGGLNLRGEATYFQPVKNFTDTTGTIGISVGADYVFSNSLMLQSEVLYNNVSSVFKHIGVLGLYAAPLSAKYLSICDWTAFLQASYPVTSRFTGSLSGMYFININTFYVGVNGTFSLSDNWDLSAIVQYFVGNDNQLSSQTAMGFLRLKYSF